MVVLVLVEVAVVVLVLVVVDVDVLVLVVVDDDVLELVTVELLVLVELEVDVELLVDVELDVDVELLLLLVVLELLLVELLVLVDDVLDVEVLVVVELLVLVAVELEVEVEVEVVNSQQSDGWHSEPAHARVGNGSRRYMPSAQPDWSYCGDAHDPSSAHTYGLYSTVCRGRYEAPSRWRAGDTSVAKYANPFAYSGPVRAGDGYSGPLTWPVNDALVENNLNVSRSFIWSSDTPMVQGLTVSTIPRE